MSDKTLSVILIHDLNNIRRDMTIALRRSRDNLVTMEELYSQAEYAVGEIDSALAKVDVTISKIEEPLI